MNAWSNFKARLGFPGPSEQQSDVLPRLEARIAHLESQLSRIAAALEASGRAAAQMAALEARRQILDILDDPRLDDPRRLERSGFSVHSEYDEDGIISEIFRRIGTTNRRCVEFGAGNGTENCTGFLLMQGWKCLWIDGRDDLMVFLEGGWKPELERGQLVARQTMISVDTIDGIIRDAGFSGEIDLLAVDLDGNDYYFLETIGAVTPRVICAEYNANMPPDLDWKMERRDGHLWDGIDYRIGASLKALETLLDKRGYALVGCSLAGVNAFFVRKDIVGDRFADPFTAENHYHPWRFFYHMPGARTNWREGRFRR